jgi:hypothetical protein
VGVLLRLVQPRPQFWLFPLSMSVLLLLLLLLLLLMQMQMLRRMLLLMSVSLQLLMPKGLFLRGPCRQKPRGRCRAPGGQARSRARRRGSLERHHAARARPQHGSRRHRRADARPR